MKNDRVRATGGIITFSLPEFLKSKKRKEREENERKMWDLEQEQIKKGKEIEEIQKGQILDEYRLIIAKKSKLSRRERDNFMTELHALVKKGTIKIEETIIEQK